MIFYLIIFFFYAFNIYVFILTLQNGTDYKCRNLRRHINLNATGVEKKILSNFSGSARLFFKSLHVGSTSLNETFNSKILF